MTSATQQDLDPLTDTKAAEDLAPSKTTRDWNQRLAPYQGANTRRSTVELLVSSGGFAVCWIACFLAYNYSLALSLLLAAPTAMFHVRLFIIQHDCGHGSYFKSRRVADTVGFWIGVLTLVPYRYWRRTHNDHHLHSGDLDGRGFGDIDTITVEEYRSRSSGARFAYRLYRNPLVLLLIGPAFQFFLKHRYPWDAPTSWKKEWAGVWKTNLALATVIVGMGFAIGFERFLWIQVPVTLFACTLGVWLFYVQHQFENTYWNRHADWNVVDASLQGSSCLVMPAVFQWLTGNIGLHHIHHLSHRIPNYSLQRCLDDIPELHTVTKLGLIEGIRCCGLQLWDERTQKLVSFRTAHRSLKAEAAPRG